MLVDIRNPNIRGRAVYCCDRCGCHEVGESIDLAPSSLQSHVIDAAMDAAHSAGIPVGWSVNGRAPSGALITYCPACTR